MSASDSATAYVASFVFIERRDPEMALEFRSEVVGDAGVSHDDWNEACEELVSYAYRVSTGDEYWEFENARIEVIESTAVEEVIE